MNMEELKQEIIKVADPFKNGIAKIENIGNDDIKKEWRTTEEWCEHMGLELKKERK